MKWTIKQIEGKYVVQFPGEDVLIFMTKASALAYINDRVLSSLGL